MKFSATPARRKPAFRPDAAAAIARDSTSATLAPRRASRYAADTPAMPPPTIATSTLRSTPSDARGAAGSASQMLIGLMRWQIRAVSDPERRRDGPEARERIQCAGVAGTCLGESPPRFVRVAEPVAARRQPGTRVVELVPLHPGVVIVVDAERLGEVLEQ